MFSSTLGCQSSNEGLKAYYFQLVVDKKESSHSLYCRQDSTSQVCCS